MYHSPIIIGGCGSSGTTLLRSIINAHPDIYCGHELNLFNNHKFYDYPFNKFGYQFIYEKFNLFYYSIKRRGFSIEEISQMADDSKSFKEFVEKIICQDLINHNKSIWAEKSPSNCRYIKFFIKIFPRCKYIHVVRDGRDVALSLIKRSYSPLEAVSRWIYDTICTYPFRENEIYYEIKYEDLVNASYETISKLFNFLQITVDAEKIIRDLKLIQIDDFPSWTLRPNENISSSAISKWVNVNKSLKFDLERLFHFVYLSDRSVKRLGLIKNLNGNDVLKIFGYENNNCWNTNRSIDSKIVYMYLRSKIGNIINQNDPNRNWSLKFR